MFRLFECCALSFFERFVLSFSLKIERFVSDSAEIWICGLYFQEACMYIGISESMLYKLTSGKEIPHYKPRGKMIYFAKEDLDEWLLQNYEPTVDEAARMANEAAATQPFFNQRRHGKRKKN